MRFTPYQKLIILDVPDDKLDELRRRPGRAGAAVDAVALAQEPDGLHRHRVLQAVVRRDPKGRAQVLVPELEKRLEDINAQLDVPITININGCPNSCARIQVADIGFKGQMVDDGDGTPSRASRYTWAAASAWTAASAASCASTRCSPPNSATTSTGSFATS